MKRIPQPNSNFTIRRERNPAALRRQAVLLLCGLSLAVGFITAAGLHFSAIRRGYASETLRRERAQLLEEQRRLSLAIEEASSPARLERAAREIGLQSAQAAQISPRRIRDTGVTEVRASVRNGTQRAATVALAGATAAVMHH